MSLFAGDFCIYRRRLGRLSGVRFDLSTQESILNLGGKANGGSWQFA